MLLRILLVVMLFAGATLFAIWWQRRQGAVRDVTGKGGLSSAELGAKRGYHATLLQFSAPMCAKCPPTATLLSGVAAQDSRIAHIEIDASERLDLARKLDIMRTPTVLVLDGDGVVVSRMSGAPSLRQVHQALAAVPRLAPDYSI